MKNFKSNSIAEFRKAKNLSQRQLAKELNTSQQNLSRWEKGINEPSIAECWKIADYFDVSHRRNLQAEKNIKNTACFATVFCISWRCEALFNACFYSPHSTYRPERHKRFAALGQAVFHFRGNLRIFFANDQPVFFQLFQ